MVLGVLGASAHDGISRIDVPFASRNTLFNVSKFLVGLRLAVKFEPIKPGNPQQNTAALVAELLPCRSVPRSDAVVSSSV